METLSLIPEARTEVQSLWFHKSKWTRGSAEKWLEEHNYRPIAKEETRNYYAFRIREPVGYLEFRRIWFSPPDKKGILATIGIKKLRPLPSALTDFFDEFDVHQEIAGNPKIQLRHLAVAVVLTALVGIIIWKSSKKQ